MNTDILDPSAGSGSILDKPIVLSLNRAWQVIGHRTVKQAPAPLPAAAAIREPKHPDWRHFLHA